VTVTRWVVVVAVGEEGVFPWVLVALVRVVARGEVGQGRVGRCSRLPVRPAQ